MEAEPDGVTVTVATDDDVPDAGGVDAGGAGVPGADGEEGAVTVSVAEPLNDPTVAVIVAAPAEMPEAKPSEETVATAGLFEFHAAGWLARTFPFASFSTTAN
jgi:hypothetical protein